MTTNKKLGIFGSLLVLAYFIYSAYIGIKISSGFGMKEAMGELQISAIISLILAFPALVLLFVDTFKKKVEWFGISYVITLLLGIGYLFLVSTDPLASALVMVWVVVISVIIWVTLLVLRDKTK